MQRWRGFGPSGPAPSKPPHSRLGPPWVQAANETCPQCLSLPCAGRLKALYGDLERLARASASPTRSGPEGSSRNEPRLGRCPTSRLFQSLRIFRCRSLSMQEPAAARQMTDSAGFAGCTVQSNGAGVPCAVHTSLLGRDSRSGEMAFADIEVPDVGNCTPRLPICRSHGKSASGGNDLECNARNQ